jgi:hypothetical protein
VCQANPSIFEEGVKATEGYRKFTADFPYSELYKLRGPFVSMAGGQIASTLVPVHIRASEDPTAWSASFRVISKDEVDDAERAIRKWFKNLPDTAQDIDEDVDTDSALGFSDSDDGEDKCERQAEKDALRRGRDLFLKGRTYNCKADYEDVGAETWKLPKYVESLLDCRILFEFTTDQFDRGAQEMHDFLLK